MYQTIILAGNLGKDPEMRYTPSGAPVTSFSVATNRQYTNNNGETVKETIWFRVSVWGKMAETCNQYLKKGSKVLVEGRLTADAATGGPRIWTGQDGSPRASFEVNANTVRFLSSRGENEGGGMGSSTPAGPDEGMAPAGDDGDIPF
ncbi:MAG TPA: single-stranded DNA-binding protein [Anaerolineales bacterium]|nr:single-stranded DNA-binding protein [Anaerolineales bacterium]